MRGNLIDAEKEEEDQKEVEEEQKEVEEEKSITSKFGINTS